MDCRSYIGIPVNVAHSIADHKQFGIRDVEPTGHLLKVVVRKSGRYGILRNRG